MATSLRKMSTTIDCFRNRKVGQVTVAVLAILCISSATFLTAPVYGRPIVAVSGNGLVSVIIGFVPTATAEEKGGLLATVGAFVTRQLTIVNGVEATIPMSAIQGLKRNPLIVAVDLNLQSHLLSTAADIQIHADQAWAAGFTGTGIRVAVLDTGIDQAHVEFQGRIVACHSEIVGVDCNPNPLPQGGWHGTAVAGMALAQGVDSRDKGVAPAALLLSDKVFDPATGMATDGAIIAGIGWAVNNGARVISMSFGRETPNDAQANCDADSTNYLNAVNNAVAAGVTLVAAAGNVPPLTQGIIALPACYSSVLAVGGVDNTNQWWNGAASGPALANHGVTAPAFNLTSTYPGNLVVIGISGTSFAAPMVSGEIALVLQKHPNLSPTEIRQLVENTANCVQPPCPNNNIGYGVVNAINAINAGVTMSTSCDPTYCSGNPTTVFIYCTFYGGCSPPSRSVPVTLTVNSVGGFSGNVNLYYVPPSGNYGNSLTGPTSIYVPAGGSNTASLTASAWSHLGYWTWTIQAGSSGNFGSVPLTIHYYYCNCG